MFISTQKYYKNLRRKELIISIALVSQMTTMESKDQDQSLSSISIQMDNKLRKD